MSRRAIAALICVGTSVVMAALVVPVMVASSIDHWASWSLLTWIDVLIPNLLLIALPGALLRRRLPNSSRPECKATEALTSAGVGCQRGLITTSWRRESGRRGLSSPVPMTGSSSFIDSANRVREGTRGAMRCSYCPTPWVRKVRCSGRCFLLSRWLPTGI